MTGVRLFAIDPGPSESGWVFCTGYEDVNGIPKMEICDSGWNGNGDVARKGSDWIRRRWNPKLRETVAIEAMGAIYRGAPVTGPMISTIRWEGRFVEMFRLKEVPPPLVVGAPSSGVYRAIGCKQRTEAFAMLNDLYGPKGTKKNPGPLYGFNAHQKSALLVAMAYCAHPEVFGPIL